MAVLLISNLVGQKICAIGPFRIAGAQLLFPITYIFGDVFTEVYGYAASRRAIWAGFFASGLLAIMGVITVALPPAPDWHNQQAFATVFHFIPRLVIASLLAFWCGEFAKTRTVGSNRGRSGGGHRGGDGGGAGTVRFSSIINLIVSGYLGKVLYEVLATPLTYAVVNGLKRAEGIDPFDTGTNFSPFAAER